MSARKQAKKTESWWGWVVVAASFFSVGITDGVFTCMGVLIIELVNELDETMANVAWIPSVYGGFMLLTAPLASGLANRFGYRPVIVGGGVLAAVSLAVSALAQSLAVYMVTIGLLTGVGMGFVYTPAISAVGLYMNDKLRATATGLAVCGSGVGMFVFPVLTSYLLDKYGLSGTLLILGAIYANCAAMGLLYRPDAMIVNNETKSTTSNEDPDSEVQQPLKSQVNDEVRPEAAGEKKLSTIELMFRFQLFRSLAFNLINLSTLVCSLGYMIPFTFLAAHAESLEFTSSESSFLLSIIGITTCAGPIVGWIADRPQVSALWVHNAAMTLGGLVIVLLPLFTSYAALATAAAAFGLSISCLMPTRPSFLADMVGVENMPSAFGYMMMFFGVSIFYGNPLAGFIFDVTGNFNGSFYLAGTLLLISAVLCYPLGILNRWQIKRKAARAPAS